MVSAIIVGLAVLWIIFLWVVVGGDVRRKKTGWSDLIAHTIFSIMVTAGSLLVIYAVMVVTTPLTVVGETKSPLKALSVNSENEGTFFLGSGSVDEDEVIKFIFQNEDGSWSIEKINVAYALIYEDETEKPYVSHDLKQQKFGTFWFFGLEHETPIEGNVHKFHIPKNSIIEDYGVSVSE